MLEDLVKRVIENIDEGSVFDALNNSLKYRLTSIITRVNHDENINIAVKIKIGDRDYSFKNQFLVVAGLISSTHPITKEERRVATNIIAGAILVIMSGPVTASIKAESISLPLRIRIVVKVEFGDGCSLKTVSFPIFGFKV